MKSGMRIAFVCYALVALAITVFGVVYICSSELRPYHQQAMGTGWQELSPTVQTMFLALLHGVGFGALEVGLALWILLLVPFRRGETWSRWALTAIACLLLIPATYFTAKLALTTGAETPYPESGQQ